MRKETKTACPAVFFQMASTEGLEPATLRLEGACSIQLSYVDNTGNIANPVNFCKHPAMILACYMHLPVVFICLHGVI